MSHSLYFLVIVQIFFVIDSSVITPSGCAETRSDEHELFEYDFQGRHKGLLSFSRLSYLCDPPPDRDHLQQGRPLHRGPHRASDLPAGARGESKVGRAEIVHGVLTFRTEVMSPPNWKFNYFLMLRLFVTRIF